MVGEALAATLMPHHGEAVGVTAVVPAGPSADGPAALHAAHLLN